VEGVGNVAGKWFHKGSVRRAKAACGLFVLLFAGAAGAARSETAKCTAQAELSAADRSALGESAVRILTAIQNQDYATLQGVLLGAVSGDWNSIKSGAERASALIEGGQIKLRNLYMIDNSAAKSTADTQAFCSNASGSMTVTITLRALPPGIYAVILADTLGGKYAGQVGLILAVENGMWKLGGISAHEGLIDGHDGVWYWSHARDLAREHNPFAAAFTYDLAAYLLVPVDYLVSPNLEKLTQEQARVMAEISPPLNFPYTLTDGPRSWKVTAMRLDPSLHHADIAIHYESLGTTDPASSRTEALAVMTALLKLQPALRSNFHGFWAYASNNGKPGFAIELPMSEIPLQ
jgi:hypothetical protein